MSIICKVSQGDCLSSIAARCGLPASKIWKDPANKEIKEKREDPNLLYPGDVIHVPDKETKNEAGGTGQRHRFTTKGMGTRMRLRFMQDDRALSYQKYVLEVDGQVREGTTNGGGWIETSIPPGATKGTVYLGKKRQMFPLAFGHVDSISEISGVQGRLKNLGWYAGDIHGKFDEYTASAIRRFQKQIGMQDTGIIDESIQNRLKEEHGG